MKKIALLFITICVSALNGMEPIEPEEFTSSETSSSELTSLSQYICSIRRLYGNNIDMLVAAIKADVDSGLVPELNDILNARFGHQKDLQAIIWLLRGIKEPLEITETIAKKLATPTAETYVALGQALLDAAKAGDITKAKLLLSSNVDYHFISGRFLDDGRTDVKHPYYINYKETTPLTYAVIYGRPQIVKLLLDKGYFPEPNYYYKFNGYYPPEFNTAFGVTGTKNDREEIQKMIHDARSEEQTEESIEKEF